MSKYLKQDRPSVFKGRGMRFRTVSLIAELIPPTSPYDPLFTIKEEDEGDLASLRRLFLEIADPTEYRFAKEVFKSWKAWDALRKSPVFKPYLDEWKEELEIKLMSESIFAIRSAINDGKAITGVQLSAAKFVASPSGKEPSKRGRPSKQEKLEKLEQEQRSKTSLADDLKRINLVN